MEKSIKKINKLNDVLASTIKSNLQSRIAGDHSNVVKSQNKIDLLREQINDIKSEVNDIKNIISDNLECKTYTINGKLYADVQAGWGFIKSFQISLNDCRSDIYGHKKCYMTIYSDLINGQLVGQKTKYIITKRTVKEVK